MDSDLPTCGLNEGWGMAQRSFNTEPGWYHEGRQAFVPELARGMRAFVFQAAEKAFLRRSQSFEPPQRTKGCTPRGSLFLRPSLGNRRVLACRGWEGENTDFLSGLLSEVRI